MDVKLKTKHIIMLSKLVTKMNLKLDITERDATKLGMNIVLEIVSKIQDAEKEFYELIGSLSGYNAEAVPEIEIDELIDILTLVVNKIVNFTRQKQGDSTT